MSAALLSLQIVNAIAYVLDNIQNSDISISTGKFGLGLQLAVFVCSGTFSGVGMGFLRWRGAGGMAGEGQEMEMEMEMGEGDGWGYKGFGRDERIIVI
jgi:hypothetical protein